jgi:hypothetical protein
VNLFNLLFCNNQFVAIASDRYATYGSHFDCDNNLIATSSDGKKWTSHNIGQYENVYALAYGDSQFVAVGRLDAILASRADNPNAVFPSRPQQSGNTAFAISFIKKNLIIKLPFSILHEKFNIQLITSSGRRIPCALIRSTNGVSQISATGMSSGIYYIRISGESGQSFSSKFILTQ